MNCWFWIILLWCFCGKGGCQNNCMCMCDRNRGCDCDCDCNPVILPTPVVPPCPPNNGTYPHLAATIWEPTFVTDAE